MARHASPRAGCCWPAPRSKPDSRRSAEIHSDPCFPLTPVFRRAGFDLDLRPVSAGPWWISAHRRRIRCYPCFMSGDVARSPQCSHLSCCQSLLKNGAIVNHPTKWLQRPAGCAHANGGLTGGAWWCISLNGIRLLPNQQTIHVQLDGPIDCCKAVIENEGGLVCRAVRPVTSNRQRHCRGWRECNYFNPTCGS